MPVSQDSLLGKYPLTILQPGYYRAATTSLAMALKELGFGPVWHFVTIDGRTLKKGQTFLINNAEKLNSNEYVDFDEWLETIQCATIMDTPVVFYWEKIFAQYPECKVILSIRDFEGWYKSIRLLVSELVSVRSTIATYLDAFHHFDVNLYWRKHMDLDMCLDGNRKQEFKELYYDKHIDKVQNIVPKSQLLLFNVKKGWGPLCEFLNVPIPNTEFPKYNSGQSFKLFVRTSQNEQIKKGLTRVLIVSACFLFSFRVCVKRFNQ